MFDSAFFIPGTKFDIQILEAVQIAVVELFSRNSIRCLLHSIPIKELFRDCNVKYRKMKVEDNDSLLKRYKVIKLPSLLFLKDGKLKGKIEGYYSNKKQRKLKRKIDKIITKIQ